VSSTNPADFHVSIALPKPAVAQLTNGTYRPAFTIAWCVLSGYLHPTTARAGGHYAHRQSKPKPR